MKITTSQLMQLIKEEMVNEIGIPWFKDKKDKTQNIFNPYVADIRGELFSAVKDGENYIATLNDDIKDSKISSPYTTHVIKISDGGFVFKEPKFYGGKKIKSSSVEKALAYLTTKRQEELDRMKKNDESFDVEV